MTWTRRQGFPRRRCQLVKLAAVGVGLPADLYPAHAAGVVVLVAVRQDQEELLPNRVRLLAAGAEQTRGLKLAEAVYHVVILDPEGRPRSSSQTGARAWRPHQSSSIAAHA
jgi:hypothetical protein